MIKVLRSKSELTPYFTTNLFENGVGVVIDESVDSSNYLAINIDNYYHHIGVNPIPEIADLLIVSKESEQEYFHLFIVEMKNIKKSAYFDINNIHGKFETAINDFMKIRYADPFLNKKYNIVEFRLFFIHDAYHLKEKGFSDLEIKSFLSGTKMEILQSMAPFEFRGKYYLVEYELPNPLLSW